MEQNKNTGGFFVRFLATLLNMLIYLSLLSLPLFVSIISGNTNIVRVAVFTASLYMLSCVFYTTYIVYFVSHFGGDLGKLLCGLKIVDASTGLHLDLKTALYRQFPGYLFSGGFFGLGYLRVLRNKDNLAWHDELFGTRVARTGSWIPGLMAVVILKVYLIFFIYSLSLITGTI